MRRSSAVVAPLLVSAAAAMLSGCGPEMQRCVDQQNHVVDPSFCKNLPQANQGNPQITGVPQYHFYYGGYGSYGYGTVASGGSFTPQAGESYSLTSGTARGGFGSLFSGGGGEGE